MTYSRFPLSKETDLTLQYKNTQCISILRNFPNLLQQKTIYKSTVPNQILVQVKSKKMSEFLTNLTGSVAIFNCLITIALACLQTKYLLSTCGRSQKRLTISSTALFQHIQSFSENALTSLAGLKRSRVRISRSMKSQS